MGARPARIYQQVLVVAKGPIPLSGPTPPRTPGSAPADPLPILCVLSAWLPALASCFSAACYMRQHAPTVSLRLPCLRWTSERVRRVVRRRARLVLSISS